MKKAITLSIALFVGLWVSAQTVNVTYYKSGNVKTTTYLDGATSERITYHESGKLKEVARFYNGKPHGQWQEFDQNETLISEGTYVNGRKTGNWLVYNHTDRKVYQVTYKNDFKVNEREWAHGQE